MIICTYGEYCNMKLLFSTFYSNPYKTKLGKITAKTVIISCKSSQRRYSVKKGVLITNFT